MPPDIDKPLLPNISSGKRKLHTGEDIAVGGHVAGGMSSAARESIERISIRPCGNRAEFFDIAYKRGIAEDLPQFAVADPETCPVERSPSIIGVAVGSNVHSTSRSAANART